MENKCRSEASWEGLQERIGEEGSHQGTGVIKQIWIKALGKGDASSLRRLRHLNLQQEDGEKKRRTINYTISS